MLKEENKSTTFIRRLNIMLNSRITPWIETSEEERFLKLFRRICQPKYDNKKEFQVLSWSVSEGLLDLKRFMVCNKSKQYEKPIPVEHIEVGAIKLPSTYSAISKDDIPKIPIITFRDTYQYMMENCEKHIYIIKDLHNFFVKNNRNDYPDMVRRIRDLIFYLRENGGNILFISPEIQLPLDLMNDIHLLPMPRPDDSDIESLLDFGLTQMKKEKPSLEFCINYTDDKGKLVKSKNKDAIAIRQKFLYNLRGLTETEIVQIISYATVKNLGLDENALEDITESKRDKIAQFEALEFVPTPENSVVGGHNSYKNYIDQRGLFLNPQIRANYNLKPPKGTLVVGIPGCGKSILAKYISLKWGVPLIRMDMGAIYGQYLGQSESQLREALRIAEANAPCILWIDEIEKAVGGGASESSGTSTRILGKLLTWLAERNEMVYVYATANNIDKIPSELLRTGRFDTIRWADLPTLTEAQEILTIHCSNNGLSLEQDDVLKLAAICVQRELTGSEIEQAVLNANFDAAAQSSEMGVPLPVTSHFVEHNLSTIKPWVESHRDELYTWRQRALNNYEFTSEEVREMVKRWVDNAKAFRTEHTDME
jgi:SpoVK/Ycf46/Vps4 family AAA+-type ATPase